MKEDIDKKEIKKLLHNSTSKLLDYAVIAVGESCQEIMEWLSDNAHVDKVILYPNEIKLRKKVNSTSTFISIDGNDIDLTYQIEVYSDYDLKYNRQTYLYRVDRRWAERGSSWDLYKELNTLCQQAIATMADYGDFGMVLRRISSITITSNEVSLAWTFTTPKGGTKTIKRSIAC